MLVRNALLLFVEHFVLTRDDVLPHVLDLLEVLLQQLRLVLGHLEPFIICRCLSCTNLRSQYLQVMRHLLNARHRLLHYVQMHSLFLVVLIDQSDSLPLIDLLFESGSVDLSLLVDRDSAINKYIVHALLLHVAPPCSLHRVPLLEVYFSFHFVEEKHLQIMKGSK